MPRGGAVIAENGLTIQAGHALGEIASGDDEIDTMIVVGGSGVYDAAVSAEVVRELAALARRSRRVASVCAGSMLLAAAGLLDGYRATTHWGSTHLLAERFPQVRVEADLIYVRDRDRWTSAGGTAGIDLALALVEDDLGAEAAQLIARWFVVFTRRPGGQAQFSAQMRAQPAKTPAIRAVHCTGSSPATWPPPPSATGSTSRRGPTRPQRPRTGSARTPDSLVEPRTTLATSSGMAEVW